MVYSHNGILLSNKRNGLLVNAMTWMSHKSVTEEKQYIL